MFCPDSAGDTAPAVSRTRPARPALRRALRNALSRALPCVVMLALAVPARAQGQTTPGAATPDSRPVPRAVASPGTRPDPADPAVSVPRVVHRSALSGAGPGAADAPIPWRSANETVNRVGGWRAYAREAAPPPAPAPSPAAPAAPTGSPARGGAQPEPATHHDQRHHGHQGHQGPRP